MIQFEPNGKKHYQFKDCKRINGRLLCPECFEHEQLDCELAHDCKNIIYDDELDSEGRLQGGNAQCQCYSAEHGLRSND
jgi:hypothetical protein